MSLLKNTLPFCENPVRVMRRCGKCSACVQNMSNGIKHPGEKVKKLKCLEPIPTDSWVPCRKCRACLQSRVSEKMIVSVFAAAEYRSKGQFLTLTYRDDELPVGLNHSHFAGFMKRLRFYDPTPGVKFHVAGEYGEKSGREHFHVLIYNHKYPIDLVERAWGRGFVYDGTLTPKSIKYVSGYVCKKGYDPGSGKRPPYGRTSCNVPDGLTPEEILSVCSTGRVQYNGRSFNVPRAWRRRYSELWKCYSPLREFISDSSEKKSCVAHLVSAIMDDKERRYALRTLKRRII